MFLVLCFAMLACTQTKSQTLDSSGTESTQFRLAFAVTDLSVGTNRLAFGIIESGEGPVRDIPIEIKTYYLDGPSPDDPIETLIPTYRSWPTGQGIYTTTVQFNHAGRWGILASSTTKNKEFDASAGISVRMKSLVPMPGNKPPMSVTKTTEIISELPSITSDPNPNIHLYKTSLNEAVTSGIPTIVVFATPAFCSTSTCGPQLEILSSFELNYGGKANFIHVEIYDNPHEIQGDISRGVVSNEVLKWNLPSEPWTFIIDSDGLISSRFEGFATFDEIEEAFTKTIN